VEKNLRDEVYEELVSLLSLLGNRISDAEVLFRNEKFDDPVQAAAFLNRNLYLVRSFQNFHRIASFLAEKISNDSNNSQMYLCQLRTLADILSRIIFTLSIDPISAARIVTCEDSISAKKIDQSMHLLHYSSFIDNNPIFTSIPNFPSAEEISRKGLEKLQKAEGIHLTMPNFEERVDTEFIKSATFDVLQQFKVSLAEALKQAHISFSQHVHGNHYFKEPHGNEVFWLATYSIALLLYSCEIIDKELLNIRKASDIRKQLSSTLVIKNKITIAWRKTLD